MDHSRSDREETISPKKLGEKKKKSEKLPVKHCSKDSRLLFQAMNWNELGTRLWGIPKGKYLTDPPPASPHILLDPM